MAEAAAPSVWLLSITEVHFPLEPGAKVFVYDKVAQIYEVRRFQCKSSPICGEPRDLFVALHSGPGSVMVFVCLKGEQQEWACANDLEKKDPTNA